MNTILEYLGGSNVTIKRVVRRSRQRVKSEKAKLTMETEVRVTRSNEPRHVGGLRKLEKARTNFLSTLRRNVALPHSY